MVPIRGILCAVLQPRGSSAGRRFLRKFGFALVSAAVFAVVFGGALYFRVPRAEWEERGKDLTLRYQLIRLLDNLELRTYDWRARELGRMSQPSRDVMIVAIDDETLSVAATDRNQGVAIQPWPRELVGGMVTEMVEQGAKLVLVDLLFSALSPRIGSTNIPAVYGVEGPELDDDFQFRQLLDRVPGKSVIAFGGRTEAIRTTGSAPFKELALVSQHEPGDPAHDVVRTVLATQRPVFRIPDGPRTQVWAGVDSAADAEALLRSLGAQSTEPVLRPRTAAERAFEVSAAELLLDLAAVEVDGLDPRRLPELAAVTPPVAPLLGTRSHYGNVSTRPDSEDGVIRGVQHLYRLRDTGQIIPSLALVAAMRVAGESRLRWSDGRLSVGDDFSFPMDATGYSLIRWDAQESVDSRGSLGAFMPAWMLVDQVSRRASGSMPRPLPQLKDKIVIFTNTTQAGNDLKPSAIGEATPGGAILGQALVNIMRSEGITRASARDDALAAGAMALVGALLALVLSGALRSGLGAVVYFASLVAVGAAYVWFTHDLFVTQQLWLALAAPLLSLCGAFLLTTIHAIRSEREVREFIFQALGRSVSPEVARKVARNFGFIRPERREVTVYFSDIEGFTRISEQMPPDQLIEFLQAYFAEMTRLVRATGGHLDKFIGDAVMAIWNAPNPNPRHAVLACESALRMRQAVLDRQAEWEKTYGHRVVARAGINTGDAVVGHVGSDLQAAYTAIGDAVNLASRLEGANKAYGSYILAGEATVERAADAFVFREVDRVRVMGKTVPTRIFELIARKGEPSDRLQLIPEFEAALAAYHQRAFDDAHQRFGRCVAEFNDPVSAVYVARCRQYLASPPDPAWDGVYELKEK